MLKLLFSTNFFPYKKIIIKFSKNRLLILHLYLITSQLISEKKAILLIKNLVNNKNVDKVFPIIAKEIKKIINSNDNQEFLNLLLETLKFLCSKFSNLN